MSSAAIENVLILQGGGSLGAFGCGVFKALVKNNIKTDIVAGTSIGGLNATIIAGSKDQNHPEKALEQFWLELAEGSTNLNFPFTEWPTDYQIQRPPASAASMEHSMSTHISQFKSLLSF